MLSIGPFASASSVETTYPSAWPAAVTNDFCALRRIYQRLLLPGTCAQLSSVIGLKADLVIAAAWVVVSTLYVIRLRDVREFTLEEATESPPVPAPS